MTLNGSSNTDKTTIVLAGATGDLGGRIARFLLRRGAHVRAVVRPESDSKKVTALRHKGVEVVESNYKSVSELAKACAGGACVVSALSGLEEVILETQRILLYAAVEAGVPRFIPSDYAIDFTRLPEGSNRNLDLRREFHRRLDKTPIKATSVLNGMFTELLTGQAPFILFPLKRVIYWDDPDQPMDFTTMDNTADFTAAAALDASAPRFLRIAGDVRSARGLKEAASEATGEEFKLVRAGSLGMLDTIIKITRTLYPSNHEVYPPWQGMQYMHNMFSGLPKLEPLDNGRYPGIAWTGVPEVLARR